MKLRVTIILILSVFFAGCSSSSSPSGIVRSWINLTEEGKADEAMKLFSNKAMQERGAKLKTDLSSHIAGISKLKEAGKTFSIEDVEEKVTGETAKVSFIYRAGENDSLRMTFDLIQESGLWKINGINDPETEPDTGNNDSPPKEIQIIEEPPPPTATPSPSKKKK